MAATKKPPASKRPVAPSNKNRAATVVRLDPALLEALDAWAAKLSEGDGPQWSRTDVIRAALARAIRERGAKGEAP